MAVDFENWLASVKATGSGSIPVEVDGKLLQLRFSKPGLGDPLAQHQSPPEPDADLTAGVDKLRHRIKKVVSCQGSLPIAVVQALCGLLGYTGSPLSNVAEGLRLLVGLTNYDAIDWATYVSVVTPEDRSATTAPPPAIAGPSTDRVDRLEASFNDLKLNLSRMIAEAVKATMVSVAATTTPPKPATQSTPPKAAGDVEMTPPPWDYKSKAPAMAVLGTIYNHLLQSGQPQLAGELYAIRGTIDYAFLTPKEADPDQKDHVYVAKKSGTRWDTRNPSPNRCYTCGGPHWRVDCPEEAEKKQQSADRSFPRGKPPARYYVSKHGKVYDTTRRPTSECSRCGKLHFWFSCPRGGDKAFIPKGASFVDHTDQRIANQSSARIRQGTDTETGDSDASLSSAGEQLPQKRNRVRIAKPQVDSTPSTPRRPPQTPSPPPVPTGYMLPYAIHPGFVPPPQQQQQQPFYPGYYPYGFPPYSAPPLPPSDIGRPPPPPPCSVNTPTPPQSFTQPQSYPVHCTQPPPVPPHPHQHQPYPTYPATEAAPQPGSTVSY